MSYLQPAPKGYVWHQDYESGEFTLMSKTSFNLRERFRDQLLQIQNSNIGEITILSTPGDDDRSEGLTTLWDQLKKD